MDEGSGTGGRRLSRRQRRDLDRLEQELVADVDLCRWFERLANDVPLAAPGRGGRSAPPSRARTSGVITSAVFAAMVLAGAALTVAGGVLQVPVFAVPALIVFLLAPVSVLVGERCRRRRRGGPATRPGRGPWSERPLAGWSTPRMWSGMEGGMWLLP
jgi:hypothetical protein